jgi:hypothetical protein
MEIHSVVSGMKQADRRVDTFNIIWSLYATTQNTNNGGPRPPVHQFKHHYKQLKNNKVSKMIT